MTAYKCEQMKYDGNIGCICWRCEFVSLCSYYVCLCVDLKRSALSASWQQASGVLVCLFVAEALSPRVTGLLGNERTDWHHQSASAACGVLHIFGLLFLFDIFPFVLYQRACKLILPGEKQRSERFSACVIQTKKLSCGWLLRF